VRLGKRHAGCPYYAGRAALPGAQLVGLPYAMLLHERTRQSLGIDLKGHVVIVDEAHNLVDALAALHSVTLSLDDVSQRAATARARARSAPLMRYARTHRWRRRPVNWGSIWRRTVHVCRRATKSSSACSRGSCPPGRTASAASARPAHPAMGPTPTALVRFSAHPITDVCLACVTNHGSATHAEELLTLAQFTFALQPSLDTVNLFAMCEYLERTHLAQKVRATLCLNGKSAAPS
jgi:hypothetical protein